MRFCVAGELAAGIWPQRQRFAVPEDVLPVSIKCQRLQRENCRLSQSLPSDAVFGDCSNSAVSWTSLRMLERSRQRQRSVDTIETSSNFSACSTEECQFLKLSVIVMVAFLGCWSLFFVSSFFFAQDYETTYLFWNTKILPNMWFSTIYQKYQPFSSLLLSRYVL